MGSAPVGVLRHVDVTALSARDAVKVEAPLQRGETFRVLHQALGGRALVAGLGHSLERPPQAAAATGALPTGTFALGATAAAGLEHGVVGSLATTTMTTMGKTTLALGATAGTSAGAAAAGGSGAAAESAACDLAGVIRLYRTPSLLAGDSFDVVSHGGPVTRVAVTPDERLVITGAADGSVGLSAFPVDTRARVVAAVSGAAATGAAAAGAGGLLSGPGGVPADERLAWAEEILVRWGEGWGGTPLLSPPPLPPPPLPPPPAPQVTKSDLEEVRRERVELEARVQEISMTNKYNER